MKIISRLQIIFYFCVLLITIPFFTIYYYDVSSEGLNSDPQSMESNLGSRLIELSDRLKHAEMVSRERKNEINFLRSQMVNLKRLLLMNHNAIRNTTSLGLEDDSFYENLNLVGGPQSSSSSHDPLAFSSDLLQLPSIYHFLPHLLSSPDSLVPAFRRALNPRNSVTMVMGVPTVKRPVESYLIATLQNLIDNLSIQERAEAVIIVFIAETDMNYVVKTAEEIESVFNVHLKSGLIEIISPPQSYYPNLDNLQENLGDKIERVKWRTKQNLDFVFLMMYAQPKGTYYVQLEDDVLSKPGYLMSMKEFAIKSSSKNKDWAMLQFCNLGFIGKMFKSVDLSKFILLFSMFHKDQPVDWILEYYFRTRMCRIDVSLKDCKKDKMKIVFQRTPSLFQHIGTHSSLKGKVQKLKDKSFGKASLFYPHLNNPHADVQTSLKTYQHHTLSGAYLGTDFFWAMNPKKGDNLTFDFKPEISIDRYFFRSGNIEHVEDKITNASIEILPLNQVNNDHYNYLNVTNDGYFVIGNFQVNGIANGTVPSVLNPVKQLRIAVRNDSDKWVILNEIEIKSLNGT